MSLHRDGAMPTSTNIIDDFFIGLNSLYTEVGPLNSIQLTKSVMCDTCPRIFLHEGIKVFITGKQGDKDRALVDCHGAPTHMITGCRGALYSNFSITVIDLETGALDEIKL